MNKLYQYLSTIRPALNIQEIERMAKRHALPTGALQKHFQKDGPHRVPLAWNHAGAVIRALCDLFGVVIIDGWTVSVEPDGPVFFRKRVDPDAPVKTKWIKSADGQGGHFEYSAPYLAVNDDEFDLCVWLGFFEDGTK